MLVLPHQVFRSISPCIVFDDDDDDEEKNEGNTRYIMLCEQKKTA